MAELEDLTQELLTIKETLAQKEKELETANNTIKERDNTIINLRSKNAELYQRVGETYEPKQEPTPEEKKDEFWQNYINSKGAKK